MTRYCLKKSLKIPSFFVATQGSLQQGVSAVHCFQGPNKLSCKVPGGWCFLKVLPLILQCLLFRNHAFSDISIQTCGLVIQTNTFSRCNTSREVLKVRAAAKFHAGPITLTFLRKLVKNNFLFNCCKIL